MGGIIFLISIVLTTVGVGSFLDLLTTQTVVLLLVLAGFGLIGLLDDGLKVVFKRNLGLTSSEVDWSNCYCYSCLFPAVCRII